MTATQRILKRGFDFSCASVGLLVALPLILICWGIACIDTGQSGFFWQERVGLHGKIFKVVKIRTMRNVKGGSTVTTSNDPRITAVGAWLRRWKLDELPQLWNVVLGQMSLVGPRPDVPGFSDQLSGDDRKILLLRPGITGPASIKYRFEEEILANASDPEKYNSEVIWPDKVRINLDYMRNWTFRKDIQYIFETILKNLWK